MQSQKPSVPPTAQSQDKISLDQAGQLHDALAQQSEIRPEMVEKGRALAADPNYPPHAVLQSIAGMILNSPDPSEDPS